MSIKDDEQFKYLFDRYKKSCGAYEINFIGYTRMQVDQKTIDDLLKKLESNQIRLIDYIDEYVSLQIYREEFPSGISFEEGLEKLPEWQKEINQRLTMALQIINDNEKKNENT